MQSTMTPADRPPDLDATIAEPKWLRFSLRTLLIVVMLTSIALGWIAWRSHRLRRQHAIVESLLRFGAVAPSGSGDVVQLSFSGDAFGGQALDRLARLPSLKRLAFIDAPVNDADLARVAKLQLEELRCINAPGITDQSVAALRRMHNLKVLWLEQSAITDAALSELAKIPNLEVLNLIGARISDQGVVDLAPAVKLKRLLVNQTAVTRSGADELQRALPKLLIQYSE